MAVSTLESEFQHTRFFSADAVAGVELPMDLKRFSDSDLYLKIGPDLEIMWRNGFMELMLDRAVDAFGFFEQDDIDPVLKPVLQKRIVHIGSTPHISIGDTQVPFDPGFRLYLTTKLANPHFSPDICVMLTVLNFQSTMQGLSDQMLGLCVRMEAPDLEKQSENLMPEDAANKAELKQIEDTILRLLDAAEVTFWMMTTSSQLCPPQGHVRQDR